MRWSSCSMASSCQDQSRANAKNFAFGHGFAVFPRVLRRPGLVAGPGRPPGERRARPAGLHRAPGRRVLTDRTWPAAGTTTGARRGGWSCSPPTRRTGSPGRRPGAPDGVITEMATSADTDGESAPADLATQVPWIREVLAALGIAVVGRRRLRGGRRHRHAGHHAPPPGRRRDRRPRPLPGRRRRPRGAGPLHRARRRQARAGRRRVGPRALRRAGRGVRRLRHPARRRLRRAARGLGHRGQDRRQPDHLLRRPGRHPRGGERVGDPGQPLGPGQAARRHRLPRRGPRGRRGRPRPRPRGDARRPRRCRARPPTRSCSTP